MPKKLVWLISGKEALANPKAIAGKLAAQITWEDNNSKEVLQATIKKVRLKRPDQSDEDVESTARELIKLGLEDEI